MVKNHVLSKFVFGVWVAAVIITVALSIVVGARWSTTALLLMTSAAPMGVAVLLGFGSARSMTTHELLYAVNHETIGRS